MNDFDRNEQLQSIASIWYWDSTYRIESIDLIAAIQ